MFFLCPIISSDFNFASYYFSIRILTNFGVQDGSGSCSGSKSPEVVDDKEPKQDLSASSSETSLPQQGVHHSENELTSGSSANKSTDHGPTTCIQKSNGPEQSVKSKSAWRRTAVSKCFLDKAMTLCNFCLPLMFFLFPYYIMKNV